MKLKIFLFSAVSSVFLLSSPAPAGAQVLDEVRQDILQENRDEIKTVSEEILRQKRLKSEKKAKKKKAFQEKIEKSQRLEAVRKRQKIISESEKLLQTIEEQSKLISQKREQYEELIEIYAEKPVDKMSLEEQKEIANQFLASATTELLEILKLKKIKEEKESRGEEVEDIVAGREILVQINQYMEIVKRIDSYKQAKQQKITKKQKAVLRSTKELIELLKQEAIRRAKVKALAKAEIEKPPMQLKKFEGTVGVHYGYDDNVNADTAFDSSLFLRNYFSLNWIPSFNQFLKAEIGTWYLGDHHMEEQDVTFKIAAGQANLKWYPTGKSNLLIQPGFEWSDTHYPNDGSLETKETNFSLKAQHTFWNNWSQELNYEDSRINSNNNRVARDGESNNLIDIALKKRKHSLEYNLRFPFLYDTRFTLKQRGSIQTSNDAYLNYYHYSSYKRTLELGRNITQKLYAKAGFSYEQKNYTQRTVSDHQVAQEDTTYIEKVNLFYFLNEDWLINYTFTHTKVDSNSTLHDYEKMTHLLGAYYSF